MIDPLSEEIVSLTDAAKLLPARRGGKRAHVSCLYRWTQSGCKGVRLESIQVGGTRCTSREALGRFFERLSNSTGSGEPSIRTPNQRARAADQAERDLIRAGY
jgi:hypothetical protein